MAAAGEAAVIMAFGAAAVGGTVEAGAAVAVGAVEDGAAMEATAVTAAATGAAGVGMDSGSGSVEDLQMSLRPLVPKDNGRSVL